MIDIFSMNDDQHSWIYELYDVVVFTETQEDRPCFWKR